MTSPAPQTCSKPLQFPGQSDTTPYEIFGRADASTALQHIGLVYAGNLSLAQAYARLLHMEKEWIELLVAPSSAFTSVMHQTPHDTLGVV